MVTKSIDHLKFILKLSDEQKDELVNIVKKMWQENELIIEQSEQSWHTSMYGPTLDKYKIKGIDDLSDAVDSFIHSTEFLMELSENGKLDSSEIDDVQDTKKIDELWEQIKKLEIVPELDYKIHNNSTNLDFRRVRWDTRFFRTIHFEQKVPIASIHFSALTVGKESKSMTFETTKTELVNLIEMFNKIKSELETMMRET